MNDELLIALYLDGELDHEESAEFERRLEQEPALLERLEEELKLSVTLERAGDFEASQLSSEGFTERVMGAIPEGLYGERAASPTSTEAHEAPVAAQPGLFSWLSARVTPLLIGAAVAAALILSLQRTQAPVQPDASGATPSTVLINLDEAKREGAAPVIWVLDEAEGSGGAEEGGDDDPI